MRSSTVLVGWESVAGQSLLRHLAQSLKYWVVNDNLFKRKQINRAVYGIFNCFYTTVFFHFYPLELKILAEIRVLFKLIANSK